MFLEVPEEFKPFILAQSRIGVGSDPGRVIVGVESGMVSEGVSDWKVPCEKVSKVVWGTEDQQ